MAKTYSCREAAKRHQGVTSKNFQLMCLRRKIPAVKVGRDWHIPESELDKLFAPQEEEAVRPYTRRASKQLVVLIEE